MIAERLRELRKARGFTLREVVNRVERSTGHSMSFSYLSSIERGTAEMPSLLVVERICRAYGITVCELLECYDSWDMEGWVWPS